MGFGGTRRKKAKAFPKTICASNQVAEEPAWQELASLGSCSLANQPKVAVVNMSVLLHGCVLFLNRSCSVWSLALWKH